MNQYPKHRLDTIYRGLYRSPLELTDLIVEKQLYEDPIWAPFGTALGKDPDRYVDDLSRINQKEGPLSGHYPENAIHYLRPLEGPPNVDQVWPDWTDIGTGYKTPPTINPNDQQKFDDWGTVVFVRLLGKGAYGEVWLTNTTKIGQPVQELACKIINLKRKPNLALSIKTLFTDSQVLIGLNHPNICSVEDIMPVGDPQTHFPYNQLMVFMEYCPDVLSDRLDRYPSGLSEIYCINLLIGAIKGLKYLHDNCVAHMDIKSPNILIAYSGQTKLADFGQSFRFSHGRPMMVPAGHKCGTPEYMAPELYHNRWGVNAKPCDIYSMGCTLLETLIGYQNFSSLASHIDVTIFVNAYAHGYIPNRSNLPYPLPHISRQMARLIGSMLCEPSHRINIDAVLANPTWSGYIPPPSIWDRTRRFCTCCN